MTRRSRFQVVSLASTILPAMPQRRASARLGTVALSVALAGAWPIPLAMASTVMTSSGRAVGDEAAPQPAPKSASAPPTVDPWAEPSTAKPATPDMRASAPATPPATTPDTRASSPATPAVTLTSLTDVPAAPPAAAQATPPAAASGIMQPTAEAKVQTQMSGASLGAAGIFFSVYGLSTISFAGLYTKDAPYLALGLMSGGLVWTIIGTSMTVSGGKRMTNPDRWLANRPLRISRMQRRANVRGVTQDAMHANPTISASGRSLYTGGVVTLALSGVLIGGSVVASMTNTTLGTGLWGAGALLLPVGIPLVVAGKRRMFLPGRYANVPTVAPSMVRTESGLVPAIGISGRL